MKTQASQKTLSILNCAVSMVRRLGFESVSISKLAQEVGMSKSGLFAHFKSKETMHIMILDHASQQFTQEVLATSLSTKRGMPRLKKIINSTVEWAGSKERGGCPFVTAAVEYDSRPGPVKDKVQYHLNRLIQVIKKAIKICIAEGHIQDNADINLMTFELYSLIMGSMVYTKTLENKHCRKYLKHSLNLLLERYSV